MVKITFEQMPQALQTMQASINELNTKIEQLQANQPINEPPITGGCFTGPVVNQQTNRNRHA